MEIGRFATRFFICQKNSTEDKLSQIGIIDEKDFVHIEVSLLT